MEQLAMAVETTKKVAKLKKELRDLHDILLWTNTDSPCWTRIQGKIRDINDRIKRLEGRA